MDDRSLDHRGDIDSEDGADIVAAAQGLGAAAPGPPAPDDGGPPATFTVTLPFEPPEVRAVMAFCVRRLVKLDSGGIQALNDALCVYEGSSRQGPEALAAARIIIDRYNKLNDLLEPLHVNGASVYDSTDFNWHRRPLVWIGTALLVAGVAAEMLAQGVPAPGAAPHPAGLADAMSYIGPMAWGGLGATVFLIKTLSDKVSDFAYEEKRLSGTAARIFLGAVFGMLIVKGFAPQLDTLPQIAIAFLAGLGTKAVYAAIEAVVNGMAARLSGQGNGPGPTGTVVSVEQEVLPGKG